LRTRAHAAKLFVKKGGDIMSTKRIGRTSFTGREKSNGKALVDLSENNRVEKNPRVNRGKTKTR